MKTVAYGSVGLSLLLAVVSFFIHPSSSYATTVQKNKLVDQVCKQTSSYSFCVESLYSDSLTPNGDRYVLAGVSFRLAYLNASATQDHIAQMLKKPSAGRQTQILQRCARDYDKAAYALEEACGDINTESYSLLTRLADVAIYNVDDCIAALKAGTSSPLIAKNEDAKALSQISLVVSKLFKISAS